MSTSISVDSRFRDALRKRMAKEVAMNGIGSVQFSSTTPCIGTDQLGSCSVVLIVSPYAAILGHVSPRLDGNNPNDATGDDHIESFMTRVTDVYRQSQSLFSANSSSWVICAVFQGEIALESQQKIMEDRLSGVGLTVDKRQTYPVPSPDDHLNRGSVFVDGRGNTVEVYVEDRLVRSLPRVQPS